MTNPQFLPGIKFNMNGNADAFFLEGSDISQWSVAAADLGDQEPHRPLRQDEELRLEPGDQHLSLSLTGPRLAGGGAPV